MNIWGCDKLVNPFLYSGFCTFPYGTFDLWNIVPCTIALSLVLDANEIRKARSLQWLFSSGFNFYTCDLASAGININNELERQNKN
jgi:hypothetical protein